MNSYHVFVSPKPEIADTDFEHSICTFLDAQIAVNHLLAYRIIRYSKGGNFAELPSYQVICDYASESELMAGFENMRPDLWRQGSHSSMMEMVAEFRVAFSSDAV